MESEQPLKCVRKRGLTLALAAVLVVPGQLQIGQAQVSKGQQILINRGLQVQGMVTKDDVFQLNTYSNAHYTSVNWLWDSNPSLTGAAPGFPWSRWVNDETKLPPQGTEAPYLSQLVSLQLGDEWNLNDDATRTRAVNWFNAIRANFPNTILYMNNYGGQVGDAQLGDFIARARPDMISFDTYPWRSDYTTRTPIRGPPTSWYGDLRRYREHARGANVPLASYVQTFHAVQDWDQTVYRDPSPSELRLNHFAALAFNVKVLIDFTYNTGASSLFVGGGDDTPTALFTEKADANRRARNFGKTLVRLKPIADATTQYTTGMMFIRGRNSSGTLNPIPISFIADPQDNTYTDWVSNRNDPYLRGWSVTNKAGLKNNGQPGGAIVSWFRPLDESFDGPGYTNEIYMMVVNGLTDPTGSAADCLQEIKLNFDFAGGGITGVDMLDPLTAQVQTQTLPILTGTVRQLVLNLNGGDAALFKFSDGAPFVGITAVNTNDPSLLIATSASWRYWDSNSPPPANWAATNFNDTAWPAGAAPLGFGDGDEATVINSNRTRITTYFRHVFSVTNSLLWTGLQLDLLRDDGAVAYLNGTEVFRSNMPLGPISPDTQAPAGALPADESTNFYTASVDVALLKPGTNVLAVEVHQFGTNSSDLSFALRLSGTNPTPTTLVAAGSDWRYLDTGVAPAAMWTGTNFNDSTWLNGPAQLGYGDGDEATVVNYGPNSTNKYITTWFRRAFTISDPASIRHLTLRVVRDDGVVVYLNRTEIFRSNLPAGALTSTTLAVAAIGGDDESAWLTTPVNPALLVAGTNILAAEIHQSATNSSDISFDLELVAYPESSLPWLNVAMQSGTFVASWPAWAGAWTPETTTNLAPPVLWSAATNAPVLSNGQWILRAPFGASGMRFYRLQTQ